MVEFIAIRTNVKFIFCLCYNKLFLYILCTLFCVCIRILLESVYDLIVTVCYHSNMEERLLPSTVS